MTLGKGAVIIPAYGKPAMTNKLLDQCLIESDTVDAIVIDNAGDLDGRAGAITLRPDRNLGWLAGTNLGLLAALSRGYAWITCLNNDTTLSPHFFRGMRQALEKNPADIIAPCYNDVLSTQNDYYRGRAAEFKGEDKSLIVTAIDGTCFSLTSETLTRVGPLDETRFGRRGWGAIEDLVLRIRKLGSESRVTRASYLEHDRGATAHSVMTSYERYALSEMRRGMRKKWGALWRENFPDLEVERDSWRLKLRDDLRNWEDAFGLSETWLGRRGVN